MNWRSCWWSCREAGLFIYALTSHRICQLSQQAELTGAPWFPLHTNLHQSCCCRTWFFGAFQNFFYGIRIAFGASAKRWQWVQPQHRYLPLQGVELCGKAQPGKQSCAGGKWAGGGESRPSAFEVGWVLSRYISPKLGGKRNETKRR